MKDLLKPGDRVFTRDGKEFVVFDHRMVHYPTSAVITALDANDYDNQGKKRKNSFCDTSDNDIVRVCRLNHTSQMLAPVNDNWVTVFSAPIVTYGIIRSGGTMQAHTFNTIAGAKEVIAKMISPEFFRVVKIEEVQ
jgi:hypothetical protein